MQKRTAFFSVVLLALVISCFFIWRYLEYSEYVEEASLRESFVVYTPHWFGNMTENELRKDIDVIRSDLLLAKSPGFHGVKLFCIEGIEGTSENFSRQVFDCCEELGLRVTLPLRVWRQEQFPENLTAISDFEEFVSTLIPKICNSSALLAYIVHYPVDYSDIYAYGQKCFGNPNYSFELQEIISHVHKLDPEHPIWMALEFNPSDYDTPVNFTFVESYGVEPYSWKTPLEYNENEVLKYTGFFESRNLSCFIDEYGVQTSNVDLVGYAPNETVKTQKIRAFILHMFRKGYTWAYFSLFDTSQADWGLVHDNGTLKESGRMIKDLLRVKSFPEWLMDPESYG
ncbi:MAG: hypothetical protein OEZ48_06635 [Candidatus Bathyarchaeota archaeon]|nr:hypothetical protein [Candidatus Bathyarchaeota archaeon]